MRFFQTLRVPVLAVLATAALAGSAIAQGMEPTTPRRAGEGDGPHQRLIIRGVTLIDGTGAPARGPMDIVIEGNRIADIRSVGYPGLPIDQERRPTGATREIDATGMFLMPGFIDNHVHAGGDPKAPQAEYAYKLWLAHGITAVRGVPLGDFDWSLEQKRLSDANQIVAPRIFNYMRPGTGRGWTGGAIQTPEAARNWVRWAARQGGVDGLKIGAHDPEIMEALIDEAKRHNLGTTAHLEQLGVVRMTADRAAQMGLGSMTHFYGLFESMLRDRHTQLYPTDYNYMDEQHRFGQVAELWHQIHEPRGPEWNAMIDRWLTLDFTINPTMVIYSAGRDVMRARQADWHDRYTLPTLWQFFQPSREAHGSYWFDWGTHEEVAWRNFYNRWFMFLNDYKNRGGRVTIGTDCGFIYQTYGFCYVTEMEMLQEAGFHPLEVIRAATLHGAEELFIPKGRPVEFGMIRPGLLADLVIVEENPLANFKTLYGTGHVKLDENAQPTRVGGVRYTIKDGIVYDARQLLADVERMVDEQKRTMPFTTESSGRN
jgi:imidazolonepropionase-like amidohydrolase